MNGKYNDLKPWYKYIGIMFKTQVYNRYIYLYYLIIMFPPNLFPTILTKHKQYGITRIFVRPPVNLLSNFFNSFLLVPHRLASPTQVWLVNKKNSDNGIFLILCICEVRRKEKSGKKVI